MPLQDSQPIVLTTGTRVLSRIVSLITRHRALASLLAGGLLLRALLLLFSASMPLQIEDERQYSQLASNLLRGHEFAFTPGALTSMRPPLYPALVAVLWHITGTESLQVVRAAQVVFSLVLVVGIYLVTIRLFDRRTAVTAATVVCFYPSLLYAGLLVLTEVVFSTLLVLFVLLFMMLLERQRPLLAVATGATLGLAALTRSVLWPFPAVLLPMMMFTMPGSVSRRGRLTACCLIGFIAVIGPWSLRNTRLQNTFVVVDTMGGMNLRMGNYEYTPEDRMWDAVNLTGDKNWSYALGQSLPEGVRVTAGQKDKWAQRAAIAYMFDNPGTTLRRSVLKFADFWGMEREMIAALQQGLYSPPRWFALLAIFAVVVAYPVVATSASIGIFRAVPTDQRVHAVIIALVVFITAIHAAVFGHSRYHLPLVPFLAMYAAAAWSTRTWRDLAKSPRSAAGPVLLVTVLLTVWLHEVLFRDAERIRQLLQALA